MRRLWILRDLPLARRRSQRLCTEVVKSDTQGTKLVREGTFKRTTQLGIHILLDKDGWLENERLYLGEKLLGKSSWKAIEIVLNASVKTLYSIWWQGKYHIGSTETTFSPRAPRSTYSELAFITRLFMRAPISFLARG